MTSRRTTWRKIKKLEENRTKESKEQTEQRGTNEEHLCTRLSNLERDALIHFSKEVKTEIETICYELIGLLRHNLLVHAEDTSNNEAKVYYLKLIGDYYRYLTEMDPIDSRTEVLEKATEYYNQALPLAEEYLKPADPCRLGLILNLSVFLFEIMLKPDQVNKEYVPQVVVVIRSFHRLVSWSRKGMIKRLQRLMCYL